MLRKLLISRLSEGPRLPIHTPGAPKPRIPFIPPAIQRGQRGDSYSRCQPQPPKRCQTLPGNPWGDPRELWGCTQADGAAASCAAPAAEGCRSNRFPETGFSALTEQPLPPPPVAMDLRAELLKSIWYAFTALDVEKSGKVSKSQLKVSPWGC